MLKDMSLRELARQFIQTNDPFTWAYASYKYGKEHWRDALANERYAIEQETQAFIEELDGLGK